VARKPPDIAALIGALNGRRVRYVITGSTAALLRGVDIRPGDLDITPALDRANLVRLAAALQELNARPDPDGPFGDWQDQPDGERRWIVRDPRPGERESRARWRPDPADPRSFDHLLETRHGALDVVPEVSGTYADLVSRATAVDAFGGTVWVEAIADLLDTLTVPRRGRDAERVRALRALQRATPRAGRRG
jgi:hypothetical protein